jgi:hypothetical protein
MIARRTRALAVAVAMTIALPTSIAHAQSADDKAAAIRLYGEAQSLMDRQDYDGACAKYAESLRLDQGVGVMLHLADCYEKQGKLASAWEMFGEAGDLATKQKDDERVTVAKKHAAALE